MGGASRLPPAAASHPFIFPVTVTWFAHHCSPSSFPECLWFTWAGNGETAASGSDASGQVDSDVIVGEDRVCCADDSEGDANASRPGDVSTRYMRCFIGRDSVLMKRRGKFGMTLDSFMKPCLVAKEKSRRIKSHMAYSINPKSPGHYRSGHNRYGQTPTWVHHTGQNTDLLIMECGLFPSPFADQKKTQPNSCQNEFLIWIFPKYW